MKFKKGVTLLLAIFISFLAITLSAGVATILTGELGLSGTSKGSLTAFYAADSGTECALYWDLNQQVFSTTSPPASVTCAGSTQTVTYTPGAYLFTFDLLFPGSNSCAHVNIDKSSSLTVVTSFGTNTACGTPPGTSVQRALEVRY